MLRFAYAFMFLSLNFFAYYGTAQGRSRDDEETGFDVNDVTFLLPLDAKDQPSPNIALDSSLVTSSVFSSLMIEATAQWISAPQGGSILNADTWRVVGMRYDPCAPGDTLGNQECIQELRLTAQSFGEFGLLDSSLHLIYRLGIGLPSPNDAVIVDLLRLKKLGSSFAQTSGQPLMVHPALTTALAKNNRAYTQAFESFLYKYAAAERLQKLTMMGLRDGSPLDWIFLGGTVEDGQWKSSLIPNITRGIGTVVELTLGGGSETFKPNAIDDKLSMASFFNNSFEDIEAKMNEIGEAAHRIENPDLSNRLSVDCVSCHSSTSARLAQRFPFVASHPTLTAKVPPRITAFPGPQMLNTHPAHWNLRALGYFGLQPSLTMRTVNESARVAKTLNSILQLPGPGKDCSAVAKSVMACFVDSSRLFGTVQSVESCLKSCRL